MKIDLNCDLGESFGRYSLGADAEIMPFITSANIACGFHAGDPQVIQTTVRLAKTHGVAIGAHPGWPDLQGFGRRRMNIPPSEVEAIVLYQIGAVAGFATSEGQVLCHVKPHGELYNQAAVDHNLAMAIARAVFRFSRDLILVGLAGSHLVNAGLELGLKVANEAFPDRGYNTDGTLMPRSQPGALLEDPMAVANHALELINNGISFGSKSQRIDTLCLHSDHPDAAGNARMLRHLLANNGVDFHHLTRSSS